MDSCSSCAGIASMLVIQNANVAVLAKVLQQQKQQGQAGVEPIRSAARTQPAGAPEPGKGTLVDVTV
jgi:hypothetical protein